MALGYGDGLYGDGRYGHPQPIDLTSAPVIPVHPVGEASPLTGNRFTRYRFDLLTTDRRKFGELDGVSSGEITWNANSQVKGGGKIEVARSETLHGSTVRVVNNLPALAESTFEASTDGFIKMSGTGYEWPSNVALDTATFYEGGKSLRVDFYAAENEQASFRLYTDLVIGKTYTLAARVMNTSGETVYLGSSDRKFSTIIPQKSDWQTITVTFVASNTLMYLGVRSISPGNESTYLDQVTLYEGTASGFNGESHRQAPFDWGHVRIRPVAIVDGMPERPLGVFVATAPSTTWDVASGVENIELLDRTSVLSQDYLIGSYTVSAGTSVIAAVKSIIRSVGEDAGSIPDDGTVVSQTLTWGAGKNKLTVINEMLDAAGYFALWSDSNGDYRVEKYSSPTDRPVEFEFLDDSKGIYLPDITVDNDIYGTPNRVVMTSQGDGQEEAWTAVASNTNPDSPLSFQARGRWVTDIQLGVEAASQADLQDKANRRLSSLITNHSTLDLNHGPVPSLRVNNVVRFRRGVAGVDALYTITSTTINFDPQELAKTTLTEIVSS